MRLKKLIKIIFLIVTIFSLRLSSTCCSDLLINDSCNSSLNIDQCYVPTIYVPRQLSYNPIFENALLLNNKILKDWDIIFSVKPVYQKSTGCKFKSYFNPDHLSILSVKENGSGDICSLWFDVGSSLENLYYSSDLQFCPVTKKYGALFYFNVHLPCDFQLIFNTALVTVKNNMNIVETHIQNTGSQSGYSTITDSFADRPTLASFASQGLLDIDGLLYGKICGSRTKAGIDDIQIKLVKELITSNCFYWDSYLLIGVPTGQGSKADYLLEPLIGSKHAQVGLGMNMSYMAREYACGSFFISGELKWRYGLKGSEYRSFDLANNKDWSRYLLLVDADDKYFTFPAINALTFLTEVTPRNSLDIYLAAHWNIKKWNFEIGYDFWYRSQEKVALCASGIERFAIADLVNIAKQDNPLSASTANISQGIFPGRNQLVSDSAFTPIQPKDINLNSGAQPKNKSNSIYGSVGYSTECKGFPVEAGISAAYERGSGVNSPDFVSTWFNIDFYF